MATYIFDSHILNAQGALVDFQTLARQHGVSPKLLDRKVARSLFLRWQTAPGVGLPTEPFKVWRRPAMPLAQDEPVQYTNLGFPPFTVLQFEEPLASVVITVHSSSGGAVMVGALVGPPAIETLTAVQNRTLSAGQSATIEFAAPLITGLLIYNASRFDQPRGVSLRAMDKVDGWQLVETVGLPVDEGHWSSLGQLHGVKQGMVGAEMPAIDAAVDRYKRGINPLGWFPRFPNGTNAPVWELPDPYGLVKECDMEFLPMLHQVAALPPEEQASKLFNFTIDPPSNPAGGVMPVTETGQAQLSPIGLLAMAAATDPLMAVALGYGTGYADEDIPKMDFGKGSLFGDASRSDWDWMITGMWEKGLDGRSDKIEYAAIVPRPSLGVPAPTPADFKVDFQANLRPAQADMDWLASIRASWERFPLTQIASVASFAAARHRVDTASPAEILLKPHDIAKGHQPIGNVRNDRDPEPTRQSATDGALTIPNDPGHARMVYAAATQNIFGLWSPWAQADIDVGQPDLPQVQFLAADLRATASGTNPACVGSLVCEISVDWRVRRPSAVTLQGLLFAASTRSSDPPSGSFPAGIQKSLGAAATAVQINFTGDTPSLAGGTVECLNEDGSAIVPAGSAQGWARRYRITIPGFSLNFAATPHIGILLRARMVERIAPMNAGSWSAVPRRAYASDPRSMPTQVDIVQLASLPDAAGECHVHLTWAPVHGALGYVVYESTETRILTSHNADPEQDEHNPVIPSLSERLAVIKQVFNDAPLRRDFTRKNADLLTTTSVDLKMPRGSTDIHVYTVLPVMAGGNEGPWPSGPNAAQSLIAYAAPKIAEPAPPTIELQMLSNKSPAAPDYRVRLRVGTRSAGGTVKRIDLHRVRVDEAARTLDSMGPPIATITENIGGWVVTSAAEGAQGITAITGEDRPAGSWRRVWYRAVAWSEDDDLRGVLKGRSAPSPAVPVVVPPASPPDLSPLSIEWPGGDPATVLVSFSSAAPVAPTPLGAHKIAVEVAASGGRSIISEKRDLDKVGTSTLTSGSGLWRIDGNPTQYRLLIQRDAIGDAVSIIVRITDPLGRVTEQVLAIAPGSLVPLPTLSPITATAIVNRANIYAFSTDAPDSNAEGPYRIRIELTPAVGTGSLGGKGGRLPGPIILGPRPTATQFRLIRGVYVFDEPLSSVPSVKALPPAGTELAVMRQTGLASENFTVVSRAKMARMFVRITTPDGRTVERSSKA